MGEIFDRKALVTRVQQDRARGSQVELRFGIGLAFVFALSIAAVTTFNGWLPVLDVEGNYHRITTTGIAPAIQLLTLGALVVLWRKTGMRSVLQIWLGVALFALLCDNAITMLGGARLSVGWYVGRFYALISAVTILLVYLSEINRAYLTSALDAHKMAASCVQLEAKVQEAQVDFLTGLPGRALFLEQAQALCVRTAAAGMANAILFIDLDGFKETNDRFGHDFGDNVLIQTAGVLTSSIRREHVAGRVGGDEFVLCLAAPAETVALFAEQVANHIVREISCFGCDVGCSIGVAVNVDGSVDLEAAIKKADDAMYAAKKRGKNRFMFHDRPRLVAVS
jgi:diguanylate cyclase (GGDEF)-like protein